jgi:hypothetical protein
MLSQYDLSLFADKLRRAKQERRLADLITGLARLNGLKYDLNLCLETLSCLQEMLRDPSRSEPGIEDNASARITMALYYTCIILYVRSTSGSGSPAPFDPRSAFDDQEKKMHNLLYNLRNEAIAHRGGGSHPSGNHSEDVVIGFRTGTNIHLGAAGRRSSQRNDVISAISLLAHKVIGRLDERLEKLSLEAEGELARVLSRNAIARNLIAECPFSEHTIAGSSTFPNLAGSFSWRDPVS